MTLKLEKKRIELKFTIWQNQVKAKLSAENADIWQRQWKMSHHIQKVFIASLNGFKLLSMCAKSQVSK